MDFPWRTEKKSQGRKCKSCQDKRKLTAKRRDRILRFISDQKSGDSPHFGAEFSLNYTENLEKKEQKPLEKIQRKSSGDGTPKFQISIPCRGRTHPENMTLRFGTQFPKSHCGIGLLPLVPLNRSVLKRSVFNTNATKLQTLAFYKSQRFSATKLGAYCFDIFGAIQGLDILGPLQHAGRGLKFWLLLWVCLSCLPWLLSRAQETKTHIGDEN